MTSGGRTRTLIHLNQPSRLGVLAKACKPETSRTQGIIGCSWCRRTATTKGAQQYVRSHGNTLLIVCWGNIFGIPKLTNKYLCPPRVVMMALASTNPEATPKWKYNTDGEFSSKQSTSCTTQAWSCAPRGTATQSMRSTWNVTHTIFNIDFLTVHNATIGAWSKKWARKTNGSRTADLEHISADPWKCQWFRSG